MTRFISSVIPTVAASPCTSRWRGRRIASMALYEPSAFHLLRQMGGPGIQAYAEISDVARCVGDGVLAGDCRGAASSFVDYWNGRGAWHAMRPAVQAALIRWAPKCPLEFRALMNEPTPAQAYHALNVPVLIMRGEHAPRPTRLVAEGLQDVLPASELQVIAGAGHMGPLTHAKEVSARIMRHIVRGGNAAAAAAFADPARDRPHAKERLTPSIHQNRNSQPEGERQ